MSFNAIRYRVTMQTPAPWNDVTYAALTLSPELVHRLGEYEAVRLYAEEAAGLAGLSPLRVTRVEREGADGTLVERRWPVPTRCSVVDRPDFASSRGSMVWP